MDSKQSQEELLNEVDELDEHELDATILLSHERHETEDIDFQLNDSEEIFTDHLKRFRFICYFAAGGIGQISQAKDLTFNRVVAVKTLNEKYKNDPRIIKAFLEECRLNAQLDHPSIVPIYALDKNNEGQWEVVMKYINGSSLSSFLKIARKAYEGKKISTKQENHALLSRLEYFLKICEVIEYCHSRKIVHGDLKPNNIMMGQFGEVYVMDWGCAKKVGTASEHLMGTPRYLPPEYLKDRVASELVDIFSLGKILYEIATLNRGNKKTSMSNITENTTTNVMFQAEWLYFSGIKVDSELKAIISKAIAPEPEQRYQNVKELVADVRRFVYNEDVSVAPFSITRKVSRLFNRNKIKSTLLASCFVFLFAITLIFGYFQTRSHRFEQKQNEQIMQRIRFQSYTEELADAIERNFLTAQAQLLMLADNLLDYAQLAPTKSTRFYNNDDYKKPETSPPGMITHPYYINPLNVNYMVRFPADKDNGIQLKMIDAEQYVHICRKVLRTDLRSYDIRTDGDIQPALFEEKSQIQRMFVRWANGVCYSYPGTYDDTDSLGYKERRKMPDNIHRIKSIVWSQPFEANSGQHRIIGRYPLYNAKREYIGVAGLEIRLDKLLFPLLEANRMDPVHRFYFIDVPGNRAAAVGNNKIVLPDADGFFPSKTHVSEILEAADHLETMKFQQYVATINGRQQFICGAPFKLSNTIFLQMMYVEDMEDHHHD